MYFVIKRNICKSFAYALINNILYYTMYNNYINCIKSFINNEIKTWNFKSDPRYTGILEHVSYAIGDAYLFEISNRFNEFYNTHKKLLIDLCNINDSCGYPIKYDFVNFSYCSPTNLRYILHSMLILTFMKDSELNNIDIVEIGGGYGGLCFFIYKLSCLFNININSYSIFDLNEPLILQKKYLDNLNINNVYFMSIDNIQNINKNSFLISNYAYSEISLNLQEIYTNKLLNPYTSHGFLTWNFIEPYNFIDNKNITKEREYPLTSNHNYYIRFTPFKN